jgi:RHS repeat-associated protein
MVKPLSRAKLLPGFVIYGYDEVGNNVLVRDALGNETTYEYDAVNRRTAMIDALGQRTEYTYDDYDRLTRTTFHDGTYKTVDYDLAGRKISETDQEGKITAFAYDSVGNLIKVTDAMDFETEYTYDEMNNRISQTDANDHTTTMAYDKQNRLICRTYPNGDQERFGYNANGNMVYKVAGNGDSTVYDYDNRNREVLRTFSGGHTVRIVYTPDSKRDSVIDYRGVTVYEYGECCSQLMKVTNPDNTFLEYDYDDNKNKIAITTPWGTTRYEYDLLNRMNRVVSPDGDTTKYFYNAVGNRDSVYHYTNGTGTGYTYDVLNRLTKVSNYGSGGVISSYEYELNNAGIRTAVIEADNSKVDYGYDDLYRLTSETRTGSNAYGISYTYDNVGNRLTENHDGVITDYVYNIRDQLETETSPSEAIVYTYDASGRQLSKTENAGVTTYKWVDNDRLDSVLTPIKTIAYTYDADDSKIGMNDGSINKNYLVDKLQPYAQVVAEYDDTQNLTTEYVYGLERISQDRAGTIHIYVADGQGSIRQLTNNTGTVSDTYDYFAFGEILNKTGSTENEFQYVGEQYDINSRFYYNRARWMNPKNGRFISVDQWVGYPQNAISLHRYLYANSSPIIYKDPTGQWSLVNVMTTVYVQAINTSRATVVYIGTTFYAGRILVRVGVASLKSWVNGQALMPQVKAAADAMYPRLATMGTHGHHVIPQYVARAFNIPINQTLVHIPASVHQYFTNAIAVQFPLRNPTANITQISQAMNALMKAYDVAIKNLLVGTGG